MNPLDSVTDNSAPTTTSELGVIPHDELTSGSADRSVRPRLPLLPLLFVSPWGSLDLLLWGMTHPAGGIPHAPPTAHRNVGVLLL